MTVCDEVLVEAELHYACKAVPPPPRVPAYGAIAIADAGTGPTMTTTYDPAVWTCTTQTGASGVAATCTAAAGLFDCPTMAVTAMAPPGGAAGGRVSCAPAGPVLDTGVQSGAKNTVTGNLGEVRAIVCTAYAVVPPYQVVCEETRP